MRWPLAIGCALGLLSVRAELLEALSWPPTGVSKGSPSTSSGQTVESVDTVATKAGFAGELLVAKGGTVLLDKGYGTVAPEGGASHAAGERWRLASITKQVTAALVVGRVETALSRLDEPVGIPEPTSSEPIPSFERLTVRQLLTHHTGLANPDASPTDNSGVPSFYTRSAPDISYCFSKPANPGAPFSYNNCDYLPFGAVEPPPVWPPGMAMARPNEIGVPGFVGGKPEPAFQLASWGAAGGLMGTARAVFDFDRSLVTGKLLPPAALAELWKPEGHGSYQALGQWVFPGQLKGCAAPKRIVQRDGEIFGVQARNYIFPDDDLVVILFTNRSADDFRIGEVWEQSGFAYDLLSAAACP